MISGSFFIPFFHIYRNKKRGYMKNRKESIYLGMLMAGILFAGGMGSYQVTRKNLEETQAVEVTVTEKTQEVLENNLENPRVALTFDDGPGSYTRQLLEMLKRKGVSASFFLLGENIQGYQEMVGRMEKEGHLIGNHSFSHKELNKLSGEEVKRELEAANRKIREITGKDPVYMRPPFGAWEKTAEKDIPMIPVMWNVDSLDWKLRNTQAVVELVMEQVKDGDIILMHDGYDTSVEAASIIIDRLKEQGYDFVTVDELIDP